MSEHKRMIFPVMADPHANYIYGLMRPGVELPALDGDAGPWVPQATPTQKQIWKWQVGDRGEIVDLADGDPMFFLMLGDLGHGKMLPDVLSVSPRYSDDVLIAEDFLDPWFSLPNMVGGLFVAGTAAHTMRHGSTEYIVASHIRKTYDKDVQASTTASFRAQGVYFDLAHHGPPDGSRSWLKGNELRYYVRSIMDEHLKAGEKPPDVVLRGHRHDRVIELIHVHTWKRTYKTWGAICPANSLFKDDYTRKATRSKTHMTAGMIALEVLDGRVVEIHDFTHVADIRRRVILR